MAERWAEPAKIINSRGDPLERIYLVGGLDAIRHSPAAVCPSVLPPPIPRCSVCLNTLPGISQPKEAIMLRRAVWALVVVVCLAAPMAVHAQGDYLDVYMVKVKPEKLADFQALTKKWIDANRRFNGDRWLALETVYGESNVYLFTSTRKDYADVGATEAAAMLAANKAFGKETAQKMEQDFSNCLVWSRSEL